MQIAEGGPAFNTRAAKVDGDRPVTPDLEITQNSFTIMATDKPLRPQQFSGSQDDALINLQISLLLELLKATYSSSSSSSKSLCYVTFRHKRSFK